MARRTQRQTKRLPGGATPPRTPGAVPLPQVLDPERQWVVRGAPEGANVGSVARAANGGLGVMTVPVGLTDRDHSIRVHEMAHVKWTPAGAPGADGIPWETVNAVEDCRIHKRLSEVGISRGETPLLTQTDLQSLRERLEDGRLQPIDGARLLAAALRTADEHGIRHTLDTAGMDWVSRRLDTLDKQYLQPRRPAWKRTVEMARELELAFHKPPPADDVMDRLRHEAEQEGNNLGPARWGRMDIETPPLTVKLPRSRMARVERRSCDTGAVPRNWHRLPSDGRVFSRRVKRQGGGTVLLDMSGSMGLSRDDLQRIIETYPGILVAGYSGQGHAGTLTILARNGKRVGDDDVYSRHGGNAIDGPALEWLAEQDGPRVWISDGQVIDSTDTWRAEPFADAQRIVAEGNITRIPDVWSILDDHPNGA